MGAWVARGLDIPRPSHGDAVEPERATDRRDGLRRAEMLQQPVVAPPADRRFAVGASGIVNLEDEPRIVVEIARKGRCEAEAPDVEPVGRHEAGAFLEGIERGGEIEPAIARERPGGVRGLVGIAADPEIAFEHLARLLGKARAVRRTGEKALRDLARRAPTDAGDPGNRENVLHEGFGGLRSLALDGREEARIIGRRLALGGPRKTVT